MGVRNSGKKKKSSFRQAGVFVLAMLVYLSDNTTASSFEFSGGKNKKPRFPAQAVPQVMAFDCTNPPKSFEISTLFETIRLEAKNCPDKIQLKNAKLKHNLVTFNLGGKTQLSEFAYLARGENIFVLSAGKKEYTYSVFRQ